MADVNPYNYEPASSDEHADPSLESATEAERYPREFHRSASYSRTAGLYTVVGFLAIGFGLLMFAVNLFLIPGNVGAITLQMTTTMPILVGFFTLTNAYQLSKTPHVVRLWPEGIEIHGMHSAQLPWSEIARVSVEQVAMGQFKRIDLKDSSDKTIVSISGALDHFDVLVKNVKEAVQPLQTSDQPRKAEAVHRKRGRMRTIGFVFSGVLTVLGFSFMLYESYWTWHWGEQMKSASVGTGTVMERKVAPNGRTKRLYVEVEGDQGNRFTHNFEVDDDLFGSTSVGSKVEVKYVPADPRIAELTHGQVFDGDPLTSLAGTIIVAVLMAMMSTLFWTMAIVSWKGYDIKFANSRFSLVPLGE